jgi:hypothetical protein
MKMTYQPNFRDPRVLAKIKTSVGFVGACLSETKPRQWSTRYIDKHLGHQGNNLSKWLRDQLLICVNENYVFGDQGHVCKEYVRNCLGYQQLLGILNKTSTTYPSVIQVETQVVTEWAKTQFQEELRTRRFRYKEKSNRYWHDLQFVKRDHKQKIFADSGLKFQYDIQCCAPTLIHQLSQMIPEIQQDGQYIQGPMDQYLPAFVEFLADRTQVRNRIAQETGITPQQAKEVINAVLMGAPLGHNPDSAIYCMLKGNTEVIDALKQNTTLQQLRDDIRMCWKHIRPTLPVTYVTDKNGKTRRRPISAKQKAGVYFDLERRVITSVRNYLDQTSNQYFLEHDGWVCAQEVNQEQLIQHIRNQTGFRVKLDFTILD